MIYADMSKKDLVEYINETYNKDVKKKDYSQEELVQLATELEEAKASVNPPEPSEGEQKTEAKKKNEAAEKAEEVVTKKRTKEKKGYPRRVNKNILQTGRSGLSTG